MGNPVSHDFCRVPHSTGKILIILDATWKVRFTVELQILERARAKGGAGRNWYSSVSTKQPEYIYSSNEVCSLSTLLGFSLMWAKVDPFAFTIFFKGMKTHKPQRKPLLFFESSESVFLTNNPRDNNYIASWHPRILIYTTFGGLSSSNSHASRLPLRPLPFLFRKGFLRATESERDSLARQRLMNVIMWENLLHSCRNRPFRQIPKNYSALLFSCSLKETPLAMETVPWIGTESSFLLIYLGIYSLASWSWISYSSSCCSALFFAFRF